MNHNHKSNEAMKRLLIHTLFVALISAFTIMAHATETRYYFVRGGQLPQDITSVDLRPNYGGTEWNLRNIYRSENARYALFEKRADSWWQVTVNASKANPVDLSEIDNTWTLCMRLRRTVNYPLTLCLLGQTTAEGYTITTTEVPADGQWYTIKVPLSKFTTPLAFDQPQTNTLFRLHSDLGYAGNEVGIDFCYLTGDPTMLDLGQVRDETRFYLVSNDKTPRNVPYDMTDYFSRISMKYSGWMQWAYVPFPFYSMDAAAPVAMQLCASTPLNMDIVDNDWCIVAQVMTDMQGELQATFYLDGYAYAYTIAADQLTRDGKTWNRLYLPLDQAQLNTYTQSTPVVFSLKANTMTAGIMSVASIMVTNNHSASDPKPVVPGDPANGQQIWLVNDGTPLPEMSNIVDYRLFYTDNLSVGYGNNTKRKETDPWLTLLPTNGWYSADVSAAKPVDLSAVQADWKMHAAISTTSTYRPINLILYKLANAQLYRYQLTENDLPTAQNGNWFEFEIPMSTFLGAEKSLPSYAQSNRILSFHSDNGGVAGVEVSLKYLYFSKEGESTPAPIPGETPMIEPTLTPVSTEGLDQITDDNQPTKILKDGQIYIRRADGTLHDILGRKIH